MARAALAHLPAVLEQPLLHWFEPGHGLDRLEIFVVGRAVLFPSHHLSRALDRAVSCEGDGKIWCRSGRTEGIASEKAKSARARHAVKLQNLIHSGKKFYREIFLPRTLKKVGGALQGRAMAYSLSRVSGVCGGVLRLSRSYSQQAGVGL